MPAKLYRVSLTQEKREHLLGITRRGQSSGRKVKRSLILCKADEGLTDQQVAKALMVGPATVRRVRQRGPGRALPLDVVIACRRGGEAGVDRLYLQGDSQPGAEKNQLKPWRKRSGAFPR